MDETVDRTMVVGYEPADTYVAQTTVSNMTTILASNFDAEALDALLYREEDEKTVSRQGLPEASSKNKSPTESTKNSF